MARISAEKRAKMRVFYKKKKNKKNKKIVDKQLNDEYNSKSHAGVVQW